MNFVKRDLVEPRSVVLAAPKVSRSSTRSWRIPYRAIEPLAMAVDATAIFVISIVSGVLYHLEFVKVQGNLSQFAGFAAVVAFLFVTLTKSRGLYALPELLNLKSQISRISQNWAIVFLFLTAAVFAMKVGDAFSRGATITFAFAGILVLLAVRLLWRIGLADGLAVRKFSGRRIALIAEKSI